MAFTPRDEIERLVERLADTIAPADDDQIAHADEPATGASIATPAHDAPAAPERRDRSQLPPVYLEARRRLRERLEQKSTS
jgi:hypothetical protein